MDHIVGRIVAAASEVGHAAVRGWQPYAGVGLSQLVAVRGDAHVARGVARALCACTVDGAREEDEVGASHRSVRGRPHG